MKVTVENEDFSVGLEYSSVHEDNDLNSLLTCAGIVFNKLEQGGAFTAIPSEYSLTLNWKAKKKSSHNPN